MIALLPKLAEAHRLGNVIGAVALVAGCHLDAIATLDAAEHNDPGRSDGGAMDGIGVDAASTPDAAPVEHDYACVAVGSSLSDGFFSLRGFAGRLYAGQFGYGYEAVSMLFRYEPWEHVSPGITGVGESICAMREFGGHLYANTENSGDIFRSVDGENWSRVYNGTDGAIGCGLEVHAGQLYAVSYDYGSHRDGKILRTADGTTWHDVWNSGADDLYLRELTSHQGVLYAFATDEGSSQGRMLTSTDGTDWTSSATPTRFFRGHSWSGSLWLGSSDRRSNGVAGVWRYDGTGDPILVHPVSKHYVTELTDWDGVLFAGTSDGWKEDVGTSSLLMSRDGATWEPVCTFDEIAVWSIAVAADQLYVGTWEYGSGGKVYRVNILASP